jgi:hypothetical protein
VWSDSVGSPVRTPASHCVHVCMRVHSLSNYCDLYSEYWEGLAKAQVDMLDRKQAQLAQRRGQIAFSSGGKIPGTIVQHITARSLENEKQRMCGSGLWCAFWCLNCGWMSGCVCTV